MSEIIKLQESTRIGVKAELLIGAMFFCFHLGLAAYVFFHMEAKELEAFLPEILLALISLAGNSILWVAAFCFFKKASEYDKNNNGSIVARHLNSTNRAIFLGIAILNFTLSCCMLLGLLDHEKFRSIVPGVVGASAWAYIYTSWQILKSNRYMFSSYGKVTAALFLVFIFAALHFAITVFVGSAITKYFLLFTLGALLCILGGSAGIGTQIFYFLTRDGNISDLLRKYVEEKFPGKESDVVLQRLGDYGLYSEKEIKDEGLANIVYILSTSTDCGIKVADCSSLHDWAGQVLESKRR